MELLDVFDGGEAALEAVLDSRSARAERQRACLDGDGCCLISFTLNLPGPNKQFSLAKAAFLRGMALLEETFGPSLRLRHCHHPVTGSEAIFSLSLPAAAVKQKTVELEECHPLGRLFDLDVIGADGISVSRAALGQPPRRCLLCQQDARVCGRSRAHSLELLRVRVAQLLNDFFREDCAGRYAACATRAMLQEVSATPKPGLVDRDNSGAHTDMDFSTFMDSAAALSPWFGQMFRAGWDCRGQSAAALFERLRFVGGQAERAMLSATGGVNTHKGLIFTLGALCGAAGALQTGGGGVLPMEELLSLCREMGKCALADFGDPAQRGHTSGQRAYHAHGLSGARGQLAQGFPDVFSVGLPALEDKLARGWPLNDGAVFTLLALLARTDDTNLIHRGGLERARRCKEEAAQLLEVQDREALLSRLRALDGVYRRENLSPGGCADLLCLTLALHFALAEGLISQ